MSSPLVCSFPEHLPRSIRCVDTRGLRSSESCWKSLIWSGIFANGKVTTSMLTQRSWLGAKDLLNNRRAYVAVSRGRYDAQIYTNNAATLRQALSRDVTHSPAIQQEPVAHKIESQTRHTNQISQDLGLGP